MITFDVGHAPSNARSEPSRRFGYTPVISFLFLVPSSKLRIVALRTTFKIDGSHFSMFSDAPVVELSSEIDTARSPAESIAENWVFAREKFPTPIFCIRGSRCIGLQQIVTYVTELDDISTPKRSNSLKYLTFSDLDFDLDLKFGCDPSSRSGYMGSRKFFTSDLVAQAMNGFW